MKQSQLFFKTAKETSQDTQAISHRFLLRAGFVDQLMAGVYTFLPLGFRVLQKIEGIVRENMKSEPVSGQEVLMPALNPKENWQKTGRWNSLDILFKLKGRDNKEYVLAPTHEEVIVPLAKKIIFSYRDLPFSLFHIQDKFRDELRVKSGILRTREFMMKDLYSFHATQEDLDKYYDKVAKAYLNIFKECGIYSAGKNKITYQTLASGGTFSKYSDEFQTVAKFGEDTIYICKKCSTAINKEIINENKVCPKCKGTNFEEKKAIEVGNIFKLGTKYSLPFDLKFRAKDGKEKPVIMGCYGIGLGRLMGAIVEVNNDDKGIVWPKKVAPFLVHLIQIENSVKVRRATEKIYEKVCARGAPVSDWLYDDREDKSAGEKLVEADLISIPYRIVVSEKTLNKKSLEFKKRNSEKISLIKENQVLKLIESCTP